MRYLDSYFWERYFREYDKLNILIPYRNLLAEYLPYVSANSKVLDLGSGTGNLSILIKTEKNSSVHSLDIEKAGHMLHKEKDPNATIIQHDILQPLPFDDETFDAVVCNNVLYAVPPQKRFEVLKETHRVLKKGGVIIIANPKKGISLFRIFFAHIIHDTKKTGLAQATYKLFRFIIPTIKIFYYNFLIKKEAESGAYSYFSEGEQKKLLLSVFSDVRLSKQVYEDQAYLDVAVK